MFCQIFNKTLTFLNIFFMITNNYKQFYSIFYFLIKFNLVATEISHVLFTSTVPKREHTKQYPFSAQLTRQVQIIYSVALSASVFSCFLISSPDVSHHLEAGKFKLRIGICPMASLVSSICLWDWTTTWKKMERNFTK